MEIGRAKYGTGKTTFKIEDGDNVYRILPPLGKLAKSGKWNQYYRVEWGFKNSEGRQRPFQDVRVVNFKTQMVEVESPAHVQREGLKARKLELTAELRKDPKNNALKQQMTDLTDAIKRFNLDAKYYINAIDLSGKIGLLKLGSRAFKDLKLEIDKLRASGVDPLSVNDGRFFNFNRSNATGNFQDTAYKVTVFTESVLVNGKKYQEDMVHVIDQSIIDRLDEEAFELSGMFPVVTAAQVQRMVDEGASAVDEILGSDGDSKAVQDDDGGDVATPVVAAPLVTKAPVAPAPTKAAPPAATKKAAPPVVTQEEVESEEDVVVASSGGDLSDDEFLKSIGAIG
jgi:hypothetical protein